MKLASEIIENLDKKEIEDGRTINDMFVIDGVPLWSLIKPMIYSYLPYPIKSLEQIQSGISENKNHGDNFLQSFILRNKVKLSESIKQCITKNSKNHEEGSEILFVGYTNYATKDESGKSEFVWFSDIVKNLESLGKKPLVVTCSPISRNPLLGLKNYDNIFNSYVDGGIIKESKRISKDLHAKWKKLSYASRCKAFSLDGKNYYEFFKSDMETIFSQEILNILAKYYFTFKKIIVDSKIKIVYVNALYGFYDVSLLAACYHTGTKVVFSPHGYAGVDGFSELDYIITKNPLYENMYYVVQNTADMAALVKSGIKKGKVFATGLPLFDRIPHYIRNNVARKDNISITFFSNTSVENKQMSKKEYFDYVRAYLSDIKKTVDCKLIIKMHPVERNRSEYIRILKDLGLDDFEVIQTSSKDDLYAIIAASDIVIGFTSTVLIESIMLDKDVILIEGFFERIKNMNFEGATIKVEKSGDLGEAIRNIINNAKTRTLLKKKRTIYIKTYFYNLDGKSSYRISRVLSKLLRSF